MYIEYMTTNGYKALHQLREVEAPFPKVIRYGERDQEARGNGLQAHGQLRQPRMD